jgi:hypothetical protein
VIRLRVSRVERETTTTVLGRPVALRSTTLDNDLYNFLAAKKMILSATAGDPTRVNRVIDRQTCELVVGERRHPTAAMSSGD